MTTARQGGSGDGLVRAYVVTGGRSMPGRNHFDHATLISLSGAAVHLSRAHLNPEQGSILDCLAVSAQSVAELSALLRQPVSVLRILLADLMTTGHISTNGRWTDAAPAPDRDLLERVIAGLRHI